MGQTSYAIALGSNRRHGRYGGPAHILAEAARQLATSTMRLDRLSRIRATPALGPSGRSFANAAALVSSELAPPEMLARLKAIERAFGRRRGRRWGARVLDLDIILWSGGCWEQDGLVIPHRHFRDRAFVLEPLEEIAPGWRDPITGATVRQLRYLNRKPLPSGPRTGGSGAG